VKGIEPTHRSIEAKVGFEPTPIFLKSSIGKHLDGANGQNRPFFAAITGPQMPFFAREST
jgi:hypothetical protein